MARSQMKIRLPQDLKGWVHRRAEENMRPMNSEIILLLEVAKKEIERKEKNLNI